MNTIFDNLSKYVDLSIFRESKKDSKSSIRRHYLSLVGLLEYVDILNGDLPDHSLPDGMTPDDVKRMVSHAIGDLDTMRDASTDGPLPEHEYVDLGLPSGTLWATENIKDADGNELYFAWGETRGYTAEQVGRSEEGKITFTENDYEFGTEKTLKKYNETDGLIVLEPKDDAATINWGEEWKIPTKEQIDEMTANTQWEWTEIDSIRGVKFTSTVENHTDKFIFFPAAGFADDGNSWNVGTGSCWWSASLKEGRSYRSYVWLYFDSADNPGLVPGKFNVTRNFGCSIRPVRVQANQIAEDSQNAQGTQGSEGAQGA